MMIKESSIGVVEHVRPRLPLNKIVQMNLGFFGLQFSFGLQQANMAPIYSYLGASESKLPLLWLAGPITGLIVQPIVGAMSDRTAGRLGRRTPYFVVGAVLCSLGLLAMPYSPTLWVAASLLWILDAANNVTMEPYRAYVGDRLDARQRPFGFLTQSAFTGLAQTLSYLAPSLLVYFGMSRDGIDANGIPSVTRIAFQIGAVLSITTILWSVITVPELPLNEEDRAAIQRRRLSVATTFADIRDAVVQMPRPMRQLALPMLCQWYAMFCYWQYIVYALGRSLYQTADPTASSFRDSVLIAGRLGGVYNAVAFIAAFLLVPLTRRIGSKLVHSGAVLISGASMLMIPWANHETVLLLPMIGIGIGWASMMGSPYIMLTAAIPEQRTGIYMGIFNMFIVVPMIVESLTMPLIYPWLLNSDPRNVLLLAGALMLIAAATTLLIGDKVSQKAPLRIGSRASGQASDEAS